MGQGLRLLKFYGSGGTRAGADGPIAGRFPVCSAAQKPFGTFDGRRRSCQWTALLDAVCRKRERLPALEDFLRAVCVCAAVSRPCRKGLVLQAFYGAAFAPAPNRDCGTEAAEPAKHKAFLTARDIFFLKEKSFVCAVNYSEKRAWSAFRPRNS